MAEWMLCGAPLPMVGVDLKPQLQAFGPTFVPRLGYRPGGAPSIFEQVVFQGHGMLLRLVSKKSRGPEQDQRGDIDNLPFHLRKGGGQAKMALPIPREKRIVAKMGSNKTIKANVDHQKGDWQLAKAIYKDQKQAPIRRSAIPRLSSKTKSVPP